MGGDYHEFGIHLQLSCCVWCASRTWRRKLAARNGHQASVGSFAIKRPENLLMNRAIFVPEMKRKVPLLWIMMSGLFWAFYCTQAIAVLQAPTTEVDQTRRTSVVAIAQINEIPREHAPYDPYLQSTSSAGGILPLEEFAGSTNEEETGRETKIGQAQSHQLYRYLASASTKQVRPSHLRGFQTNIPLYLLLGNLRVHDCAEGLFS